jgi:hypothetical protein
MAQKPLQKKAKKAPKQQAANRHGKPALTKKGVHGAGNAAPAVQCLSPHPPPTLACMHASLLLRVALQGR